jgi:hypothetical protein
MVGQALLLKPVGGGRVVGKAPMPGLKGGCQAVAGSCSPRLAALVWPGVP